MLGQRRSASKFRKADGEASPPSGAFQSTMKDPEFLAETRKANMDVDPVNGEELERVVGGFFKLDPVVVNKLKEILK